MHRRIFQRVFAPGRLPHQRRRALAQGLQRPLGLGCADRVARFVAVEAQRLGVVGAVGLVLPTALALLDDSDQPSGLKALELSNNGILVEYSKTGTPAKDQLLQLLGKQFRQAGRFERGKGHSHPG